MPWRHSRIGVIFCRRSRWRNSFRPFGSPHSLIRQSEKRSSSSFEKRGENPCGHRSVSSITSIKNSPLQPRTATQALSTIHGRSFAIENGSTYTTISKMPTLQERKTRLEMLCRKIRLRRHFAARAARGDFVSSFSSPWPRQTPERDGTLVW